MEVLAFNFGPPKNPSIFRTYDSRLTPFWHDDHFGSRARLGEASRAFEPNFFATKKIHRNLHPRKRTAKGTWNTPLEKDRRNISKPPIFGFKMNFRGCKARDSRDKNLWLSAMETSTPHVLPIRAGWTFHNDADLVTNYLSNSGDCSEHWWHQISPNLFHFRCFFL